jgi:hypothetical protein
VTFYEQLGVDRRASTEQIERAFRKLARKVHPDVAAGDARRMQQLNEIRDTLTDPARRAIYDASLDAPGPPSAPYVPGVPGEDLTGSRPTAPSLLRLLGLTIGAGLTAAGVFVLTHRSAPEPAPPAAVDDAGLVIDAPPLLATPTRAAAPTRPDDDDAPTAPRPGRTVVRIGTHAEDVIRRLGAPDRVVPGAHPGEATFYYGGLRLELTGGRVTGGDATR